VTRDISIFRHRDPLTTVLRMDFTSSREADPWTQAAQMFVILLLTDRGSVPSDPERGTAFLGDLKAGNLYSDMLLKANFEFAAQDIFAYLFNAGYNAADRPGPRLAKANLTRWSVGNGTVEMWVELLSDAGDVIHYDLPIRL
jgi:hypothetical protein